MLGEIITKHATRLDLDLLLVAAVIHQESAGDPWAIRYEPNFFRRYVQNKDRSRIGGYVPRMCSFDTEKKARSTSWGAMQIMGQVARERGFRGEFLSELCDPDVNISFGCEFLAHLLRTRGSVESALLRWNGGANKAYPTEVLAHIDSGACHRHLFRS